MAAWYFNAENEAEILEAKELQSHSVRRDLNPGTKIKSKSMSDDTIINRTGRYFYSFIEHKDTKTRSHTDNFGENNVKCLIAKGICRFVPHSSAGGF